LLGSGGMGEVHEADDLATGRRVALKILSQKLDAPDARRRFLNEGRLAATINHPNSVYVFGAEEIAGVPVIAMELMPGGTLEDKVRANGPLPVTVAVDAALQIIDGLAAAHDAGILHRDIKPSNCFVDADGSVKIGDYGLSISTKGHERPPIGEEAFMGTPAFAAPEQLRGDDLTVRSDIYSFGATLFFVLTGNLPHQANARSGMDHR
jgi:serine/threonine protein kinase